MRRDRRRSLRLLGGAFVVAALPTFAQPVRIYRLGFLASSGPGAYKRLLGELIGGLRQHDYVEGKNLAIEQRWTDGAVAPLVAHAAELAKLPVDVIVSWGTPASVAAQKATSRVPVVMVSVADPLGSKLVQSLSRPGGNVTGVSNISAQLSGKTLALLKEVVPIATRVGVLRNVSNPASRPQFEDAERAAKVLGITLHIVDTGEKGDFDAAFEALKRERVDGVIALADLILIARREQIARAAQRHGIPTAFARSENVEAGGLMSYGPDLGEQFRRAAGYVHQVLQGASPANLPVEQPTRLELVINLTTAKALGLTIPATVLIRADRVIE